jgi:transcriptional regulator
MSPPRSELPQGTLDLLILSALSLEPLHGYAIAQRLQQFSREVIQVRQGSLYPALHRLESRGLLSTEWRQSETGRDAKYYTLTERGAAVLDDERASWRRLARAVGAVLRTSEGEAR